MSFKDLQNHVKKGGTKAMLLLALEASAINAAAQEKTVQDSAKVQTIQIDKQKPQYTSKTINLFGVPVEQIEQDGELYNQVGDVLVEGSNLDRKKISKDWKKSEKEAFANAEPDTQERISIKDVTYAGRYDVNAKNITMSLVETDNLEDLAGYVQDVAAANPELKKEEIGKQVNSTIAFAEALRDPQSDVYKAVKTHEEQHKNNDKLGTYAPGLSPEQYGILCQYDEYAASVAELNSYCCGYKKALESGVSKEDALKIFDNEADFGFYKQAIQNGLDPDSKEGKKLMMEGTYDMWKNVRRNNFVYQQQISGFGSDNVSTSDYASTLIGNEKEMQKRIDKIFDNICENKYCKENGITSPGNLSKYLPEEKMELLPQVKECIEDAVEVHTGVNQENRETIKDSIAGKSDVKKTKNLIKIMTGRKAPEQVAAKKKTDGNTQSKNDKMVSRKIAEDIGKTL